LATKFVTPIARVATNVSKIRSFVISALQELYPGPIPDSAVKLLDRLIYGIAQYLTIPLNEYIGNHHSSGFPNQVDTGFVFPAHPGTKRPLPEDTLDILTRVTQLPNYNDANPDIRSAIETDIQLLS
jgi:hypothetical protein